MIWASAKERGRPAKLAKSGCRNVPLPASFTYGETAAPAFLYSYVPFLLLGFVFQFIARHLLYTPECVIVVGSFATSHHYCSMCVQLPSQESCCSPRWRSVIAAYSILPGHLRATAFQPMLHLFRSELMRFAGPKVGIFYAIRGIVLVIL